MPEASCLPLWTQPIRFILWSLLQISQWDSTLETLSLNLKKSHALLLALGWAFLHSGYSHVCPVKDLSTSAKSILWVPHAKNQSFMICSCVLHSTNQHPYMTSVVSAWPQAAVLPLLHYSECYIISSVTLFWVLPYFEALVETCLL